MWAFLPGEVKESDASSRCARALSFFDGVGLAFLAGAGEGVGDFAARGDFFVPDVGIFLAAAAAAFGAAGAAAPFFDIIM